MSMLFNDYCLERIEIEYDKVKIKVSINDSCKELVCNGFIGIRYMGQWDENVISEMTVEDEDEFCLENKKIIKDNDISELPGAGWMDINGKWKHIKIVLKDGVEIHIACKEFTWTDGE